MQNFPYMEIKMPRSSISVLRLRNSKIVAHPHVTTFQSKKSFSKSHHLFLRYVAYKKSKFRLHIKKNNSFSSLRAPLKKCKRTAHPHVITFQTNKSLPKSVHPIKRYIDDGRTQVIKFGPTSNKYASLVGRFAASSLRLIRV